MQYRSYLNHAAISPPSTAVQAAAEEVLADFASHGVSSFLRWMEQRERLRSKIAQLIEGNASEIGYVANTTTGVLQTAWSINWQRGERIVLYQGEFPTNITPWQRVAKEYALDISWINAENAYLDIEKLLIETEQALQRGARVLAISAVQFQTGLALPLKKIGQLCKNYETLFFVDGIQAVGALPLSVKDSHIDFLSCGSHKWLMGLEGCGFLYIAQDVLPKLQPRLTGWLSHHDGLQFLFEGSGHLRYDRPFQQNAAFVEGGAYNTIGFAALEKSIDILLQLQITNIHNHINLLLNEIEDQLKALGYRSLRHSHLRSGILSLRPPDDCDGKKIIETLESLGISCSYPDGNIRLSPHWPNHRREVPLIIDAFQRATALAR